MTFGAGNSPWPAPARASAWRSRGWHRRRPRRADDRAHTERLAVAPHLAAHGSAALLCGVSAAEPGAASVLLAADSGAIATLAKALARDLAPVRLGQPADTAEAALFFAAANDFLSGWIVAVDGGLTVT